ncbi:MAG TPA: glycosyltransferase family 4 protein [Steroidobacteraceae bacterium]|nr:glycosyltransferase family 4 protein [Steroidobacteraceae bacterium]
MQIAIISRCARTLYIFRRALILNATSKAASVIAMGAGGDGFEERLRAAQISFEAVPISFSGFSPLADLRLIFVLWRRFRTLRIDVCHAFTIKPAVFATLAAALARVPVRIVTITGLGYGFTSAGGWVRGLIEILYRVALRYAHRVYFQNAQDRELFVSRGLVADEKTRLVAGSGVDLKRFQPAPLPSEQGSTPVFLMIARLLKDKGVLEYQAAAAELRARFPDARCLLLGGEDARNPSRLDSTELAVLRSSPDITLLAECDDVRAIIAEADVLVLPSYREGLPRSLLEGGAMGRALIATDVPGCRDVVEPGMNGLLVERGNAASLAGAMLQMAADPRMILTFGANAHRIVTERFDEQNVIDNALASYRELLERHLRDAKSAASN